MWEQALDLGYGHALVCAQEVARHAAAVEIKQEQHKVGQGGAGTPVQGP